MYQLEAAPWALGSWEKSTTEHVLQVGSRVRVASYGPFRGMRGTLHGSYASLLIRATDQRRSKKSFGLRSTSARFQRKCFFPLSANLRKIHKFAKRGRYPTRCATR